MGSRGIPNQYGGFEQFAEYLSIGLLQKGHEVFVYNSSLHPYKKVEWNSVHIIHSKDWENRLGTAGQFLYDRNCIRDALKRNFDVLLHLGYTSDSIWHKQWPKNSVNIVNMDGLEWKRTKYNKIVKKFLKKAELLAANHADVLVADSPEIQKYLFEKYGKSSVYIPYGATVFETPDTESLKRVKLQPHFYYLMIARIEPENNLETVIKGCHLSKSDFPLVIVGNINNKYGRYLQSKYAATKTIFLNGIYDQEILNNLRYFSSIYFHGHSVGGTNPSLLEAMACNCYVVAHNNHFNRSVLENEGEYFKNPVDISEIINDSKNEMIIHRWKKTNEERIRTKYNKHKVIDRYEEQMLMSLKKKYDKN